VRILYHVAKLRRKAWFFCNTYVNLQHLCKTYQEKAMAEFLSLTVTGMKCANCENNLKTKLEALNGVSSVVVSHKEKAVELEFEPEKITEDGIFDVIEDAGFKVEY
jgi:copper chaperone